MMQFIFGVKSAVDIGVGIHVLVQHGSEQRTGYHGLRLCRRRGVQHQHWRRRNCAAVFRQARGQTFVGNIDYKIALDGRSIEFALPKSLIGAGVTTVKMMADINDSAFLPGDYTFAPYNVTDPASIPQPAANGYRIAIVYSQTSAANYFGDMAYSQLFMAAQSQAMAAGIPFDVISETDLAAAICQRCRTMTPLYFPPSSMCRRTTRKLKPF